MESNSSDRKSLSGKMSAEAFCGENVSFCMIRPIPREDSQKLAETNRKIKKNNNNSYLQFLHLMLYSSRGEFESEGEHAVVKRENFSRKKVAILSALREAKDHPTAEQLYDRLKPKYPNLSLGTVYRNLKLFCENGQAASVGVIDGHERFDGIVEPHAHFLCERCGCIRDIVHDFFGPVELSQISEYTGCAVRSASVMFRGVCKNCQDDGAKPN